MRLVRHCRSGYPRDLPLTAGTPLDACHVLKAVAIGIGVVAGVQVARSESALRAIGQVIGPD